MRSNRIIPPLALAFLTLALLFTSCASHPDLARGGSLALTSASERGVEVSISIERTLAGTIFLHATFTPPAGDHLYGKDIPVTGVDGVGRPTLLELPAGSKMAALGTLIESISPSLEDFELLKLPIYPSGPVTLSLPISLPPGEGWIEDSVSVSYMVCNEKGCKPPVLDKRIPVRVPGADSISN